MDVLKGMIKKEITLSKKQMLLTVSMFAVFTALCILVRLSMECGNIADDAELRDHLMDNLWVLRYLPFVVLAFSYNPSLTLYGDIESGFLRLCKTTSYSIRSLIGTKVIMLLIFETCVFAVNAVYIVILSLIGGDEGIFSSMAVLLKMTLFFCAVLLLILFFSTVTEKKKTFEVALTAVVTLSGMAFEPFLINKMEKYSGRTDIDVLDILRLELAPLFKVIFPLCVLLYISGVLLNIFVGSKLLKRRDG